MLLSSESNTFSFVTKCVQLIKFGCYWPIKKIFCVDAWNLWTLVNIHWYKYMNKWVNIWIFSSKYLIYASQSANVKVGAWVDSWIFSSKYMIFASQPTNVNVGTSIRICNSSFSPSYWIFSSKYLIFASQPANVNVNEWAVASSVNICIQTALLCSEIRAREI